MMLPRLSLVLAPFQMNNFVARLDPLYNTHCFHFSFSFHINTRVEDESSLPPLTISHFQVWTWHIWTWVTTNCGGYPGPLSPAWGWWRRSSWMAIWSPGWGPGPCGTPGPAASRWGCSDPFFRSLHFHQVLTLCWISANWHRVQLVQLQA